MVIQKGFDGVFELHQITILFFGYSDELTPEVPNSSWKIDYHGYLT